MFERMWRDDYLLYCNGGCISTTEIELSVIWYIACADWLFRTSTTDDNVTLPLNSRQVWGYPHKSGQNIKGGLHGDRCNNMYI